MKKYKFIVFLGLIFFGVKDKCFAQSIQIDKVYKTDFCVRAFSFSNDDYFARLAYNAKTIQLEDLINSQKHVIGLGKENQGIKFLSFHENSNYLAAATYSGTIDLWEITTQTLLKRYAIHQGAVNMVKFIPGKKTLISAGNDGLIYLIDSLKHPVVLSQNQDIIRAFDISKNGKLMVSVGNNKQVTVWDLKTRNKKLIPTLFKNILTAISFSNDNTKLLVGDIEGYLYIIDIYSLKIQKTLKIHDHIISAIVPFHNNNILTSSYDGYVKKIDLKNQVIDILFYAESYKSQHNYIIHMTSSKNQNRLAFSDRIGNLYLCTIRN